MKKALLLSILFLFLFIAVSCTVNFDGSTAIQEVFARELYNEGIYLDNGYLTLIIKQDKSVTPLDYYLVKIQKQGEEDANNIEIKYGDNFDIIKPLQMQRGIYAITVTGYKDGVDVCSGVVEGYVLSDSNSTLELSVLAKGHTHNIVWQSDATYHWKGCSLCTYTEPDTKAAHEYSGEPDSEGKYFCTVCGRQKPVDASSGFDAKEGEVEPKGHFVGSNADTTWTFTFVDDNSSYSSSVVAWFINGNEVDATTEKTLETAIETYKRVLVLCVFKNEKGYGSYEVMIDGTWNKYEI